MPFLMDESNRPQGQQTHSGWVSPFLGGSYARQGGMPKAYSFQADNCQPGRNLHGLAVLLLVCVVSHLSRKILLPDEIVVALSLVGWCG